ncbi:hypothetical Protein YC6258_03148 [Gynuella sunshinyii YC6258]|uniref:Uncharacterized protein n=1 Tax=Gynuella sunshinyii YC6258 TaxID=1445510 RepID=A0A0C5VXR4_9GAMM|nr:hypothetical Protein YC6258_03148 [Gynuella sunshinyii YC6258]
MIDRSDNELAGCQNNIDDHSIRGNIPHDYLAVLRVILVG